MKKINIIQKSPQELNLFLNTFEYGSIYCDIDKSSWWKYYKTISPNIFLKNKIGICWDYVEFERYIFKNIFKIPFKTFYIELDNINKSTHTFLVYFQNEKYYYFESSFEKIRGIHKFDSMEKVFKFVLKNMFDSENGVCDYKILEYENDKKYNLKTLQFMEYINKIGKQIFIKK